MNLTTIKKRSRLGFTLVELIVVIAILAILAGIAIPVYSNYIKKANEAADLQLLDAVNTAFAAACLENNVAAKKLPDGKATITVDGDKCISGVEVDAAGITAAAIKATHTNNGFAMLGAHSVRLAATTSETINASFLKYFAGNTDKALKFFDSSDDFEFKDGAFHAVGTGGSSGEGGSSTYSFYGSDVTLSQTDIDNLKNSVFGKMGAVDLTHNVDKVSGIAADLLSQNKGKRYMNDPGFVEFMTGILPEGTQISELSPEQKANALVLYAAHQSSGKTGSQYVTAFTTDLDTTAGNIMLGNPEYLADAAAAYAVMMAFANSEYGERYEINGQSLKTYFDSQTMTLAHMRDVAILMGNIDQNITLKDGEEAIPETYTLKPDPDNEGQFIQAPDSAMKSFTKQFAEEQLDGYLSALNMVDSNLNNIDSAKILTLLQSGYASDDVVNLLKQVLGES